MQPMEEVRRLVLTKLSGTLKDTVFSASVAVESKIQNIFVRDIENNYVSPLISGND